MATREEQIASIKKQAEAISGNLATFKAAEDAGMKIDSKKTTLADAKKAVQKKSEVGVISSNQGLKEVKKSQETEARLSPYQGVDAKGSVYDIGNKTSYTEALKDPKLAETSGVQNKDFVIYADADGREVKLEGDALTPEKQQELEGQGYTTIESSLSSKEADPEIQRAQKELDDANKTLKSYSRQMMNLLISDSELQSELNSITASFDAQQQEMARINENRQQSIRTLGIRLGSRYSGGSGGVMGSIIAEEQRQGIARIADLEAQKQAALIGAKRSAKEFNFQLYTKQVEQAESIQKEKSAEVKKLVEIQRKREEELKQQNIKVSREMTIADLVQQGVTDVMSIQNLMNYTEDGELVGDMSAEEIQKVLDVINPPEDMSGLSGDYRTYKYMMEQGELSPSASYPDYLAMIANSKRAPGSGSKGISLDSSGQRELLGAGFTSAQISSIESDIQEYGIDVVLDDSNLSSKQKLAIQKAYGGEGAEEETEFLNRDYFKNIFSDDQLITAAEEAGMIEKSGFINKKANVTEYLDYLERTVDLYRQAGYTDQEILKMMQ